MLNCRLVPWALAAVTLALPAAAQEMQPHRAVYVATVLEKGKPSGGPPGTWARLKGDSMCRVFARFFHRDFAKVCLMFPFWMDSMWSSLPQLLVVITAAIAVVLRVTAVH